jgi:hypothetical protein
MAPNPVGSLVDPTFTWRDQAFLLILLVVGILYTITGYAWLEVAILLFERRLKYVAALIATVGAVVLATMFGFTVSGLNNVGINVNTIAAF